jgi:hypothetical protein
MRRHINFHGHYSFAPADLGGARRALRDPDAPDDDSARPRARSSGSQQLVEQPASPRGRRRIPLMALRSHTIELAPDAFDLVSREARRRGVSPGQVVEEIIRTDLAITDGGNLMAALRRAADLRSTLPHLDGVALAREARADLEARGA